MNIPKGYRLVPFVASMEMKNAGWRECDRQGIDPESIEMQTIWHSMIEGFPGIEISAYDEAKERELFEGCNPIPRGVEWSLKSSRYIGASDHFAISVYQSGWDGWKACAKSRAGIQS